MSRSAERDTAAVRRRRNTSGEIEKKKRIFGSEADKVGKVLKIRFFFQP